MRSTANYISLCQALIRAKLAYRNQAPAPYPFRVDIALTYRCNYRCKTCDIWKIYRESPNLARKEMAIDDYDSLFETLSSHLFWLGLTGGEPLLRKDLVNIIYLAYSKLPRLHILELTTNGFSSRVMEGRINEILEDTKFPFITVGVSMDGPPLLHDSIRGVEGAWGRALATYKKLCEISISYPNLLPHICYTVSRYNAGKLHKFIETVSKEGIDHYALSITLEHIGHLYHNIQSVGSIYDEPYANQAKADIRFLLRRRSYLKPQKKSIIDLGRRLFYKMYLTSAMKFLDNHHKMVIPCAALIGSCFMDPFGNIYPCSIYQRKLGNVKELSFRGIWYSKSANSLREDIKQGKCPNCWSPCEAEQSFLISLPKTLLLALAGK